MPGYRLYWREGAGSLAVEVVLALCGLEAERIRIDTASAEHRKPPFLAINPMGQIPVLVLPDGTVLCETAAMLLHLADSFPQAGLLPPPGSSKRAEALRWLMLQATTLYSAALRDTFPGRYTGEAGEAAAAGVRRAATAEMDRVFGILADAVKGPFMFGAEPGLGDPYLAMLSYWYPPSLEHPKLRGLRDAVLAHPVAGPAWRRHEGIAG